MSFYALYRQLKTEMICACEDIFPIVLIPNNGLKVIASAGIVPFPAPCHSATELWEACQVPDSSFFSWEQSCTAQFDPGEEAGFSDFILVSAAETFKAGE